MLLEVDGAVADSATGAAVPGHPAEALALAANDLGRRGLALEAGWIVLTGGMSDAVPARPASSWPRTSPTRLGSAVGGEGGARGDMPLVEVTLVQGRTPDQMRALIHELHEAVVRAVDAAPASVRVIVREVPAAHWSASDHTLAERRAATP